MGSIGETQFLTERYEGLAPSSEFAAKQYRPALQGNGEVEEEEGCKRERDLRSEEINARGDGERVGEGCLPK